MTKDEAVQRYAKALSDAGVPSEAVEQFAQLFDLSLLTVTQDKPDPDNLDELQSPIQALESALAKGEN